ncbi:HEPN domain-containing protein [Tateyamaria sp.]|uniref:HEPN domain-containing protein n=1 Tax=Tateyamaria sp. TaxID=1929288 RepID=UPI00329CE8A5
MFEEEILPENCRQTREMIWRMYRDAADHDYLLARFSARSNLLYQFWWNAQQAIEKYLKAALLLNGKPTVTYRHGLKKMLEEAQGFSGDLLPMVLCPPKDVRSKNRLNPRGFLPIKEFVEKVERNGDANNRYRISSVSTERRDLLYFDETCFHLRRISFPLDMKLDDKNSTAREELLANRNIQLHPEMGFDNFFERTHKEAWDEYFRWCNFAYFYEETVARGEYPSWGGSINAEPFLAHKSGKETELNSLSWVAENSFPKNLQKIVSKKIGEKRRKPR